MKAPFPTVRTVPVATRYLFLLKSYARYTDQASRKIAQIFLVKTRCSVNNFWIGGDKNPLQSSPESLVSSGSNEPGNDPVSILSEKLQPLYSSHMGEKFIT